MFYINYTQEEKREKERKREGRMGGSVTWHSSGAPYADRKFTKNLSVPHQAGSEFSSAEKMKGKLF